MKGKWLARLVTCTLFWIFLTSSSWAGQLVTQEVKSWAKEALEQEKTLKTISEPNTVAVLYFYNQTGWSDLDLLQKGLAIMLMTDLSKVKEINVVERVKLQALVDELDLGVSGLVEAETSSRVGRLLGAEYLVGGDIIKGKMDEFQLKSSLLEVPTEELFGEPAATGELLRELFRMEKDLLFEIIEDLEIELSPGEMEALRKPLTTSIKALLYLFEGVEHSDRGEYLKANEFYEKALEEDPGLSLPSDAIQEIQEHDLIEEPEAYSEPEVRAISIPESAESDAFDDVEDQDKTERENNLKVGGIDFTWHFYDYTTDMIVDESSLYESIDITNVDPVLLAKVENGDFTPSAYKPGLQTMGQDEDGKPKLFLKPETVDRINRSHFLAYAVQVEEDSLNKKILEMHREAIDRSLRDDINNALEYGDMRRRDDLLTQKRDAEAGRVLKDREGNWVRVQQYILRPDDRTVQMLNVCLRGGSGDLAGLSTIDWRTGFTESIQGVNLKALPWKSWLATRTGPDGVRYVTTTSDAPCLHDMSVRFTNPRNESLQESRGFGSEIVQFESGFGQYITNEQLTMVSHAGSETYDYASGSHVRDGQYQVVRDHSGQSNNPGGFDYVFQSGGIERTVNVAFFVVGDSDNSDNEGISDDDYSKVEFNDIWDALRVNENGETDTYIGNNNLETAVDREMSLFTKPIDVVYIPMSRMLWK